MEQWKYLLMEQWMINSTHPKQVLNSIWNRCLIQTLQRNELFFKVLEAFHQTNEWNEFFFETFTAYLHRIEWILTLTSTFIQLIQEWMMEINIQTSFKLMRPTSFPNHLTSLNIASFSSSKKGTVKIYKLGFTSINWTNKLFFLPREISDKQHLS